LLDRAEKGPEPGSGGQGTARQGKAAGGTRSPRSRRVAGRTAATAAPQWPRPAPSPTAGQEDEDSAGDRAGQPAEAEAPPAEVIPLPLFDARKEAEKWW
jgi:hypothetical protein